MDVDGNDLGGHVFLVGQFFQRVVKGIEALGDGAFDMDIVGGFFAFADVGFQIQDVEPGRGQGGGDVRSS